MAGTIHRTSDNYIDFSVKDEEDDDPPGIIMQFKQDPREMAAELRKAAAWLEEHADVDINMDID